MPDGLDQINVFTRRLISTEPEIYDNLFNHDGLTYMLRNSFKKDFAGGSTINENFLYDVLPGGFYQKGKKFNTIQKQTEQQLRFDMKYVEVAVTLYAEDIQVLNRGPLAVTKLIKARVAEGMMAIGAFLSIMSYLNGQASYSANVNGFDEALNDGTNVGPFGNTYVSYGQNTRNGVVGASLNSTPFNVGSGSTPGTIEYDVLNGQYFNCYQGTGEWEPNTVMTTPKGYGIIQNRFQTQQRFQNVKLDAGFTGMQFNGSVVMASRYVPGSDIAATSPQSRANRVAVQVLTETLGQGPNAAPQPYPTLQVPASESLLILNARKEKLNLYISSDGVYQGGFREFIPEANSTVLTGLCLMGVNLTVPTPYLHQWVYGFNA